MLIKTLISGFLPTILIVSISGGGILLYNNQQTISVNNNEELVDNTEKEGVKEISEKMDRIIENMSEYISNYSKDNLLTTESPSTTLTDKKTSYEDINYLDPENQLFSDEKLSNIMEIKSYLSELKTKKNEFQVQAKKFSNSSHELIKTIKGLGDLNYIRIKHYGEQHHDILSNNIKLDEFANLDVPQRLISPVHEWPIYKTGLGFMYPTNKPDNLAYVSVMNYNKNNYKTIPLHKQIKKEFFEITQTRKAMDKIVQKIYQVKKRLYEAEESMKPNKVT